MSVFFYIKKTSDFLKNTDVSRTKKVFQVVYIFIKSSLSKV